MSVELPATAVGEPYHRQLRNHTWTWWRPIAGGLLIVLGYFIAALIPLAIAMALHPDPEGTVSWAQLLAINIGLASLILLTIVVARVLHGQPSGLLSSVQRGLRWRALAVFAGAAVVAEGFLVLALNLLPLDFVEDASGPARDAAAVITVVLLTSALQSAGEEYLFRGYLMQAFGAAFRNPIFAIVITALLFAAVHGAQKPMLFLDRFAFGLVAGWVTVRTGGLEAAIAIHAVNNITTFVFAALTDNLNDSLNATDAPVSIVLLDIAKFVLFGLLAIWIARRRGLRRSAPIEYAGTPALSAGAQPPGQGWPGQPWPNQQWQPGPGTWPAQPPGQPPAQPPGQSPPGVPPEQRRD